jgi:hypothetical protein
MSKSHHRLHVAKHPNSTEVVEHLKGIVKEAEKGHICSVFVLVEHDDSCCNWSFAGRNRNTIELVGHLEFVKADFLKTIMDRR